MRLRLGAVAAAAAAAATAPSLVSAPALIDRLGPPLQPPSGHRRLAAADDSGSSPLRPLRVLVDEGSLHEATAQPYASCFRVGAWYRRGFPASPTPPANGVPTCPRDGSEWSLAWREGCWGRCLASDVLTPEARRLILFVARAVAAELESLLLVRAERTALTVSTGTPEYHWAFAPKGYDMTPRCAFDCQTISGVAVNASRYCEDDAWAHGADAVLSVTKPAVFSGIRGSGSSCASHARSGRPLWLVFDWIEPMATAALAPDCGAHHVCFDEATALTRWRGLVMHELLHALGFSIGRFHAALAGRGLLDLREVVDADGERDRVWHFLPGTRAHAAASQYFGCAAGDGRAPGGWQGLPLMGRPDVGRNSHWDTRILRDDVMSYGQRDAVSFVTLAAMEDLGLYRANYSSASCMAWGFGRGCAFVAYRCSAPRSGGGVRITADEDAAVASRCGGAPYWSSLYDGYLASKCDGGLDPCAAAAAGGGAQQGGGCAAECYTGPARPAQCMLLPPPSAATPAKEPLADDDVGVASPPPPPPSPAHLADWGRLLLWLGVAALTTALLHDWLVPSRGSEHALLSTSALLLVLGGAGGLFAVYAAWVDRLAGVHFFDGLFGAWSLAAAGAFALAQMVSGALAASGTLRRARLPLVVAWRLSLLLLALEAAAAASVAFWYAGATAWRVDALATSAFVCGAYQKCCRPDWLDEGAEACDGEGARWPWEDAAHPNFCQFAAGGTLMPPPSVCERSWLFFARTDRAQCQRDFCAAGARGYDAFEAEVAAALATRAPALAAGALAMGALQALHVANAIQLARRWRRDEE